MITDYSKLTTEGINSKSGNLDALSPAGIADVMSDSLLDVYAAVEKAKPEIAFAIDTAAHSIIKGGRIIYAGCGTSGRMGVLDASECKPTFSAENVFIGIIAGGDTALRNSVENAEDNYDDGREQIKKLGINENDTVIAISASGTAPWCMGVIDEADARGAETFALCCVEDSLLSKNAKHSITAVTGAEILSGSTRLKAGTATKLILNMISTGAFAMTGKVYKNLMVDVRATNTKLRDRCVRIVMNATGVNREKAEALISEAGGHLKTAIVMYNAQTDKNAAANALENTGGSVRKAINSLKSL